MTTFPKTGRPQLAGRESGGKRPSSRPSSASRRGRPSVPEKFASNSSTVDSQEVARKAPVPKAPIPKAPLRPQSASRPSHDTAGHMKENAPGPSADAIGHMDEQEHATSNSPEPDHAHTSHHEQAVVDDRSKTGIDHSVHWSQLKKPHKQDLMQQAMAQMERLKKNDDILERLNKEDSARKLQTAKLMSSVAGHIVNAIEQDDGQTVKKPALLRSAKSVIRDAALDKLTKVMIEAEEAEQAKKEEEEQEEEEGWEMLAFEESPARKRERKDGYTITTQMRKTSMPHAPRERKGKAPLDLIGVLEVVPNTPPSQARARSVERETHRERITVHAADFMKYGNDMKMLKTLNVEPPPISDPEAVEESKKESVVEEQKREHPVEEVPFVPFDPWAGKGFREKFNQNDSGINEVWFPPSPQKKGGSQSQSSTRAPSVESVHDRLFRQTLHRPTTADSKQPRSRRGSGAGIQNSQVPHSRGHSVSASRPGSRPPSLPPSQAGSSQPASRPPSARGSRPGSARRDSTGPGLPALPPKIHSV